MFQFLYHPFPDALLLDDVMVNFDFDPCIPFRFEFEGGQTGKYPGPQSFCSYTEHQMVLFMDILIKLQPYN